MKAEQKNICQPIATPPHHWLITFYKLKVTNTCIAILIWPDFSKQHMRISFILLLPSKGPYALVQKAKL